MEKTQAKATFSRFGFSYTAIYLLYFAVVLIAYLIITSVTGDAEASSDLPGILANFGLRFVVIYPIMYLAIRKLPKFEIKKNKLGFGGFLACVCISYTLMYFANLFGLFLNSMLGKLTGQGAVNPILDVVEAIPPALQVVIVAILAPIWEELLFRKFLLDRIAGYGEVLAMLLSGFMFGLYHGNLAQFTYATAIGCFFAFIYLRTGKIYITIILHMIINGLSTFLTSFLLSGVNIREMMGYLTNGDMEGYTNFINENIGALAALSIAGMVMIIVLITGIGLMIGLRRKFVFEHREGEIPKGERFKTAIFNPGMLFYVIFWIGSIVLAQFGISLFNQLFNILH